MYRARYLVLLVFGEGHPDMATFDVRNRSFVPSLTTLACSLFFFLHFYLMLSPSLSGSFIQFNSKNCCIFCTMLFFPLLPIATIQVFLSLSYFRATLVSCFMVRGNSSCLRNLWRKFLMFSLSKCLFIVPYYRDHSSFPLSFIPSFILNVSLQNI